jgi:SAM-dependent methyltransferase
MWRAEIRKKLGKDVSEKKSDINERHHLFSISLEKDAIDESKLSRNIPFLNKKAEEYFKVMGEDIAQELRKPFIPHETTPFLVLKLGYLLAELDFGKNLSVVDFGCGTGWLSFYLNRLGFNVTGIDVSRTAVDFARENIKKEKFYNNKNPFFFHEYDGKKLPLADSSVHYFICFDAFHHIPNQEEILAEMLRVLVPGGRVILSEPGTGHSKNSVTIEEVEKFGVLERDINIPDIEERSNRAGFKYMFIKPFITERRMNLTPEQYRPFFEGNINREINKHLMESAINNPFIILIKEGDLTENYFHKAEVKTKEETLYLQPGEKFEINVTVKNIGSLTIPSQYHINGGFCTIGSRLFQEKRMITDQFGKRPILTKDLGQGEQKEFNLIFTAPEHEGKYLLEIEPVIENCYWFSQKSNIPAKIKLLIK